jgi:hypothetical protein
MPRLTVVDPAQAEGKAKDLLQRVGQTALDFPAVELPDPVPTA